MVWDYYLSSLQQGLQAAHTVSELFVKYKNAELYEKLIYDWAKNHKTMVLLNGGNCDGLNSIHTYFTLLESQGSINPFAQFFEDGASLNQALTYVGILVPETVYGMNDLIVRNNLFYSLDPNKQCDAAKLISDELEIPFHLVDLFLTLQKFKLAH